MKKGKKKPVKDGESSSKYKFFFLLFKSFEYNKNKSSMLSHFYSRDDKKSGDSDSDSEDPEKKKLQSKLEGAIGVFLYNYITLNV